MVDRLSANSTDILYLHITTKTVIIIQTITFYFFCDRCGQQRPPSIFEAKNLIRAVIVTLSCLPGFLVNLSFQFASETYLKVYISVVPVF